MASLRLHVPQRIGFGAAVALPLLLLPMSLQPAHAGQSEIGLDTSAKVPAVQPAPAPAASAAPAPAAPPAAPAAPPKPAYVVVARIDLSTQRMTVHVGGELKHTFPVSSGRAGFPTPRGTYRAQWMSRMWYSRKYDLAPMPNSVFFHSGFAIHGTQSVGLLGRPASHGCVRLAPGNAAIFYALVQKHGLAATQIVVHGTPPAPRAPAVARHETGPSARRVVSRYTMPSYGPAPGYRAPVASQPWGWGGPRLVYPGDAPAYRPMAGHYGRVR